MTLSADRAGVLLLCFVFGAFLAGIQASDAAWLALSVVPWLLALGSIPELPWRPAFSAWAAWLGWSGLCALLSPEPWLSLVAWWRGSSVLLSLALGAAWWGRRERRFWALALALLGIVSAAGCLAGGWATRWPSALLLPPGLWAAVGAAAAAGWLCGEDPDWSRSCWLALAAGAGASAFFGGWPARIALLAAGVWCAAAGRRRSPGAVVALAAGAGAFAQWATLEAWRPAEGWRLAAAALAEHPIVGVGPGLLARELARMGAAGRGIESFALAAGAETGYFGLALFAAAAAASVPAGFHRLDSAGRAAAAAFLTLASFAFLSDLPSSPAFLAALAATAAVGLSPGRLGEARAADYGTPLRLQRWFTGLGLALAVGAAAPRELLRRSLDEAARVRSADAKVAALERAARLAPGDPWVHAELAKQNLLLQPAQVGEALRRIRRASETDPANAVYRARLSELWAAFGALDRAVPSAREALALEPRFLVPRLILAEAASAAGDAAAARAELEEARRFKELWRAGGGGDGSLARWDAEREARVEEALKRAPR